MCFQIAHLPGDVDKNGQVNINDVGDFGDLWNVHQGADPSEALCQLDLDNNDVSMFGQIWNGEGGEKKKNPDRTGGWLGSSSCHHHEPGPTADWGPPRMAEAHGPLSMAKNQEKTAFA